MAIILKLLLIKRDIMGLVAPELGSGIWMFFVFCVFAFFLYVIIHIIKAKDLTGKGKYLFFVLVLMMPIVGSFLYFNLRETNKIFK